MWQCSIFSNYYLHSNEWSLSLWNHCHLDHSSVSINLYVCHAHVYNLLCVDTFHVSYRIFSQSCQHCSWCDGEPVAMNVVKFTWFQICMMHRCVKVKPGKSVVLLKIVLNKATSDCFVNISPIFTILYILANSDIVHISYNIFLLPWKPCWPEFMLPLLW